MCARNSLNQRARDCLAKHTILGCVLAWNAVTIARSPEPRLDVLPRSGQPFDERPVIILKGTGGLAETVERIADRNPWLVGNANADFKSPQWDFVRLVPRDGGRCGEGSWAWLSCERKLKPKFIYELRLALPGAWSPNVAVVCPEDQSVCRWGVGVEQPGCKGQKGSVVVSKGEGEESEFGIHVEVDEGCLVAATALRRSDGTSTRPGDADLEVRCVAEVRDGRVSLHELGLSPGISYRVQVYRLDSMAGPVLLPGEVTVTWSGGSE